MRWLPLRGGRPGLRAPTGLAARLTLPVLATLLVTLPSGVYAQGLELTPVVDLTAAGVLNLPDPPRSGTLVRTPTGGWLYSGYMERWAWAEFDANGSFVRSSGREWNGGGPGEFRDVRGVFPLEGDTLLVLEPYLATVVLGDGTYIRREFIPFEPYRYWTWHQGAFWVSGYGPAGTGVPLMRLSSQGLQALTPIRGGPDRQSPIGHPVSWNGDLWLWEYPQGPFRRIDTTTGEVQETWAPPLQHDGVDGWRAFAVSGPDNTVVFRVDPTGEWMVFDSNRELLLRQPIPQEFVGVYMVDRDHGRSFVFSDPPVQFASAVRVFRYVLVR